MVINGMEWNRIERNGTESNCQFNLGENTYLPLSLSPFLGFPFCSVPLRSVIPDNDIEILSHFISLPPSPFRSVIPDNDIEIPTHFISLPPCPIRSVPLRYSSYTFSLYLSPSISVPLRSVPSSTC